jgi:MFS family permease
MTLSSCSCLALLTYYSLPTQQYRCYFNQGPRGPPFGPADEACSGYGSLPDEIYETLTDLDNRPEASVQGGITAAMPGGSFCGALVSGYLTDKLGRRRAIQIGCAIWIIGSIISCASQNIGMLIAGRFINGVAVGICSAQVPVYVSELAPPDKRGRVVGSQQWAITWGILIMYGSLVIPSCTALTCFSGTTFLTAAFTWMVRKLSAFLGLSR